MDFLTLGRQGVARLRRCGGLGCKKRDLQEGASPCSTRCDNSKAIPLNYRDI